MGRTERNSYCSLFLLVLRCFTSQSLLRAGVTPRITVQHCRVPPFGHLRITGYKPPPRSFSQASHVLLSRPRPRHPPCTLNCVSRTETYIPQSLLLTLRHASLRIRGIPLHIRMSNDCVLSSKRKPPLRAVFGAYAREALRPIRSENSWFSLRRHVKMSIEESPLGVKLLAKTKKNGPWEGRFSLCVETLVLHLRLHLVKVASSCCLATKSKGEPNSKRNGDHDTRKEGRDERRSYLELIKSR